MSPRVRAAMAQETTARRKGVEFVPSSGRTMPRPRKYVLLGGLAGLGFLPVFGIPTALLPTPYFVRMVPTTVWDYFVWGGTSLLLGAWVALRLYGRAARAARALPPSPQAQGEGMTIGGALGSVLAFGCPICNKVLVALLGASAVLAYVDPYRPAVGAISLAVLSLAVLLQVRDLRRPFSSDPCPGCSGRRGEAVTHPTNPRNVTE